MTDQELAQIEENVGMTAAAFITGLISHDISIEYTGPGGDFVHGLYSMACVKNPNGFWYMYIMEDKVILSSGQRHGRPHSQLEYHYADPDSISEAATCIKT